MFKNKFLNKLAFVQGMMIPGESPWFLICGGQSRAKQKALLII